MNISDTNWEDYFRAIEGRVVHPLLLDALNLFAEEIHDSPRFAIDLGCGDGTETAWLLEQGWDVLAVDGDPKAIKYLMKKVRPDQLGRLQTQIAKFEDMLLAPADLIHAAFSLPFCSPEHFDHFWNKIVKAVKPNGRVAVQFFGPNDSWAVDNPEMSFHSAEHINNMFDVFEIESFSEVDEAGQSTTGPKHWHIFEVIARKK